MACSARQSEVDNTPFNRSRYVDDIIYNAEKDDSTFSTCTDPNYFFQYFNDSKGVLYKGGKPAIESAFQAYINPGLKGQTGLIRVRFVVNCKGEAGRYRLLSSDLNYQPKVFSPKVTDQLLSLTKSLNGWEIKEIRNLKADYYQYLIFRLEEGNITAILP